jgi:hypothetical protein
VKALLAVEDVDRVSAAVAEAGISDLVTVKMFS